MNEALKKIVVNATAIVLAFVIIVLLVGLWAKRKTPCGCNGGGSTPQLKPNGGGVINPQVAPVQESFDYIGGGFDFAN